MSSEGGSQDGAKPAPIYAAIELKNDPGGKVVTQTGVIVSRGSGIGVRLLGSPRLLSPLPGLTASGTSPPMACAMGYIMSPLRGLPRGGDVNSTRQVAARRSPSKCFVRG